MSWPNILTLFRLATAPLFLAVFIGTGRGGFLSAAFDQPEHGLWVCLAIVVLSEISDVLDGILARRLNQVSNFGKLLDPYADSTFRLSVYFAFASQAHGRWIPLWMVMMLLYRDLLVTVIRTFAVERQVFIHARASGKIKAVAQGGAAIAVLILAALCGEEWVAHEAFGSGSATGVAQTLMWLVTMVTLWSAWDYTWSNRKLFSTKEPPQG